MALPAQKFAADPRIRQVQAQQRQIEKYIRIVLFQLSQIESGELWDYWMVIRETGKTTSYKKQLEKRLRDLRRQLRSFKQQREGLRLALMQSNARKIRKKNRVAARRVLKDAEKRGGLTSDEEEKLVQYMQASLRGALRLVNGNPSRGNIKFALGTLGDLMLVGGSEGACNEAFRALADAAVRRYRRVEKRFRKNPSPDNFKRMMKAYAEGSLLADESMEFPMRPAGLKVNWPEKQHTVKAGDTLESISKEYYGSPGFWDLVYIANYGIIGDNHRRLRPHIVLLIPGNKR